MVAVLETFLEDKGRFRMRIRFSVGPLAVVSLSIKFISLV